MIDWVRGQAVACIALFVALGGTAYAVTALPANSVGSKQLRKGAVTSAKIKNSTVRYSDIKRNTIRGRNVRSGTLGPREIAESKLAPVPTALSALSLQGVTAPQLKVTCPADTILSSGVCIEVAVRPAQSWGQANGTCAVANRRLALFGELTGFYSPQRPIAPGGELSASLTESTVVPGRLDAVIVQSATGTNYTFVDANGADSFAFRCVAPMTN